MPNLAALHFQSLTPVSSSLPSANRLDLSAVRVFVPMSLLAGRGVLLCSTSGRLVLLSAVRIGVYVVLHPLCGDWPSLWSNGLMMFLRVPARNSWPLMLPHCSITLGRSYRQSLQSVFPHVTVLLVLCPFTYLRCTRYLLVLFCQFYVHLQFMCTIGPSIRTTGLISDLAAISILSSYSPYTSYLPYLPF